MRNCWLFPGTTYETIKTMLNTLDIQLSKCSVRQDPNYDDKYWYHNIWHNILIAHIFNSLLDQIIKLFYDFFVFLN